MRLDHLLSRERAKKEFGAHSRSIHRKLCRSAKALIKRKNPAKQVEMTVLLLEPVSFSGIAEKRNLNVH